MLLVVGSWLWAGTGNVVVWQFCFHGSWCEDNVVKYSPLILGNITLISEYEQTPKICFYINIFSLFLPIENYIDEDLTEEELMLLEEISERPPDITRKLYNPL